MNLKNCLIGPLGQDALDHCLQKELKDGIFFDVHNFEALYQRYQPETLLLLEPLQRVLPQQIWDSEALKIGLGSYPRFVHEEINPLFDKLLAALDAFIPLENEVRQLLPDSLCVSDTTAWVLGQQHEPRDEAVIYPALLISRCTWSPRFADYFKLNAEVYYFLNTNPVRLNFFIHRSECVIVDDPFWSSFHLQVLASGASLLVPESCCGFDAFSEAGFDVNVFNSETLQTEFDRASVSGQHKTMNPLTDYYLSRTLKQAFNELSERLEAPNRVDLDVSDQAWMISCAPSSYSMSLLQGYLPRLPQSDQGIYGAFFYLSLLKNHYFEGNLELIYTRFMTCLSSLPKGLFQDLYRFYWAYLCREFSQALEPLQRVLQCLSNGECFQGPEPWLEEPVLQELFALGYASDAFVIWLRFCLSYCRVQTAQADAHEDLQILLQETYFPGAVDLWVHHHQHQLPLTYAESLLSRHPQQLRLAFAWIQELGKSKPDQALQQIQKYQKLCQCMATELNSIECLIDLKHQLSSDSAAPDIPYILWEGPLYAHSSLATINRRWIEALSESQDHQISYIPFEPPELPVPVLREWERLYAQEPSLYVSHRWPPRQNPPLKGKWVSIIPWEFGVIPESWVGYLNRLHDEVWVPSDFVAQSFAISGVDSRRLRVIPNGVDPSVYCPDGAVFTIKTRKSFKFLFVGGTIYRKGFDILIKAYCDAFSDQDDVVLVIKSFGSDSHYALLSMQQGLPQENGPEIVFIEDDLSEQEMASLYRTCDVYVHPYRGEGFGMPILEAMAAGLPTIIPNAGPAPEFCSLDAGWQVPTRIRFAESRNVQELGMAVGNPYFTEVDAVALAETMKTVVSEAELCRHKGLNAHQQAQSYSWDHIFLQLKTAINELLISPFAHRNQESWIQQQLEHHTEGSELEQALVYAPEYLPLIKAMIQCLKPHHLTRFLSQVVSCDVPIEHILEVIRLYAERFAMNLFPLSIRLETCAFILPELMSNLRLSIATVPEVVPKIGPDKGFAFSLDRVSVQPEVPVECVHYVLDSKLPDSLSPGHLWLSHPDLMAQAREAGKTSSELFYLPLAVDFEHFHPSQPKMVLPDLEDRFVFLSIFDWHKDGAWKDLLKAYFQAFSSSQSVSLVLKPYGEDFELMVDTLMQWLEQTGIDAEQIPELTFVQEVLSLDNLPGLYTGSDCFVTAHGQGSGIWSLAAQASGVPVISCGHFPFLKRPFSEVFRAGDVSHLTWLLKSHFEDPAPKQGPIVREYLIKKHHASLWRKRVEEQMIRIELLHRMDSERLGVKHVS